MHKVILILDNFFLKYEAVVKLTLSPRKTTFKKPSLIRVRNVQNLCLAIESLLSFLSSDFTVPTNMHKKIPRICVKAIKKLQILVRSFRALLVFQRRLISWFPLIYMLKMSRTTVRGIENLEIFWRFFRVLWILRRDFMVPTSLCKKCPELVFGH